MAGTRGSGTRELGVVEENLGGEFGIVEGRDKAINITLKVAPIRDKRRSAKSHDLPEGAFVAFLEQFLHHLFAREICARGDILRCCNTPTLRPEGMFEHAYPFTTDRF